jgi:hypothetical protein
VAERSSISQGVSLGVETTPGTAVAATRRLGSIGFSPGVKAEFTEQRPMGQKWLNAAIIGKEWSESAIEGSPCYTELPYIFASLLSTPTITAILDGATSTGGRTWLFGTSSSNDDTPKTYTVEQGSSVRAHRAGNVIINEMTLGFSREEVTLEGSALGQAIEDGITLSAGVTQLPQVMAIPKNFSVYLDTTAAGLGTTKLTRVLSGEIGISDRYGPLWVVDAAKPSFVTTIETTPTGSAKLLLEADAQGMAPLVDMRAGTTKFLRVEAVGANIYTGGVTVNHRLRWDAAVQVSEPEEFSDEDGVYAMGWGFSFVHDATWGKATSVEVITTTTAL